MGFRVAILPLQLSPSGSGVHCSQPPVVVQGSMCCVTLSHGGVQGGTLPKTVTSPYVLQKSRSLQFSIPSHNSAPSISHESRWLGRFPQHHRLCHHLLQPDLLSLPTLGLTPPFSDLLADLPSHSKPHSRPPLFFNQPSLKCSA